MTGASCGRRSAWHNAVVALFPRQGIFRNTALESRFERCIVELPGHTVVATHDGGAQVIGRELWRTRGGATKTIFRRILQRTERFGWRHLA